MQWLFECAVKRLLRPDYGTRHQASVTSRPYGDNDRERTSMKLVWPAAEHLAGYTRALQRGWSPDNRRPEAAQEQLVRIAGDPAGFLAEQVDREAKGPKIILPDGSEVARLPGYHKWMWDGEFCGSISFRWQPGTTALPPYCLGHIGYSVVAWKRRRG